MIEKYENLEVKDIPEDKNVPVGDVDKDIEVEVVDDTPAGDRNRKPLPRAVLETIESDDGADSPKLRAVKKAWHDERRVKEQAIRESSAAIELAQRAHNENIALRQRLRHVDNMFVNAVDGQTQSEISLAENSFKKAQEDGDAELVTKAQSRLIEAKINHDRVKQVRHQVSSQEVHEPQQNFQQQPQQQQQQQYQQVPPDEPTKDWMSRNTWYGKDKERTAIALAKHADLVEQYGEDIAHENPEGYWGAIEKTLHSRFPEHYGSQRGRPVSNVAGASRVSGGKVRMTLTKSQESVARRLGISNTDYAKEVYKLENRGR